MKITHIDLYQVEIPLLPLIAKYFPRIYDITLCRMHTDEGLEGIGESAVYNISPAERAALDEKANSYVGKDPLTLNPFVQPCLFECALLDIAG